MGEEIFFKTNTIESLNRSRTVFPGDQSLLKSIYLATVKITSKWTMRYKNCVYSIIKGFRETLVS